MTELSFELTVIFSTLTKASHQQQQDLVENISVSSSLTRSKTAATIATNQDTLPSLQSSSTKTANNTLHGGQPPQLADGSSPVILSKTADSNVYKILSYATEKRTVLKQRDSSNSLSEAGSETERSSSHDVFIFFEIPYQKWPSNKRVESVLISYRIPEKSERTVVISCISFDKHRKNVLALSHSTRSPKEGPYLSTMARSKRKKNATFFQERLIRTPAIFDFVVQDLCVKELIFSANEIDLLHIINQSKNVF